MMGFSETVQGKVNDIQTKAEIVNNNQDVGSGPELDFTGLSAEFSKLGTLPNPNVCDNAYQEISTVAGSGTLPKDGKTSLKDLTGGFDPVRTHYADVDTHVQDGWYGLAADSFDSFFAKFEGVVGNQNAAAKVLVLAMAGNKSLLTAARADTLTIADRTLEALDVLDAGGTPGTLNWNTPFKIIPVVTAIAGALVPGAGRALSLLGGLASAGGLLESKSGEDEGPKIGGGSVRTILISTEDALKDVRRRYREGEEVLRKVTQDLASTLHNYPQDFAPPRPSTFADHPEKTHTEFHPPSQRS